MMSPKLIFSLAAGFIVLIISAFAVGSCSTAMNSMQPTPTSVDGAINAGVALIQQDMYIRLTQQVIDNQRIEMGAKMTATQQVMDATATQERHEENSKATQKADYATQAAWQVTVSAGKAYDAATAQAQQEATSQAFIHATSTAAAQATATQQAITGLTATVEAKSTEIADKKTQEAPMIWAQQTAVFAEARKTEIELQKTQATMWAMAWGPIILIVIGLVAVLFYLWKKSQVGTIASDPSGRLQMVIINDNGVKRFVNPNLMSNPVLEFHGKEMTKQPLLTDQTFQREIVHGAQVVEAVKSLPPGYQRQALGMAAGMTPQNGAQINIQVVQPDRIAPVLDEVEGGLLEE